MKEFDCEKSCKKTTQMRCSSFCNKKGIISDKSVVFGCERNPMTGEISAEMNNFLNCNFWDLGIKEQCSSCDLVCPENKNKELKKIEAQKEALKSAISMFGPILAFSGKSPEELDKIKNGISSGEFNSDHLTEVVNITNYAKSILDGMMSGGQVDLSEFNKVKDLMIKKYKK